MKSFVRENALVIGAFGVAVVLLLGAVLFAAGGWRSGSSSVPQRDALTAYSWDELSAISAEIGACESEADAIRCAASYGLCGDDGALPASYKDVELADGTCVRAQLVGVWHDERTDGGKAGLTFAFVDAVGTHAMNHAFEDVEGERADSVGGWSASDMRAWLNGDFLASLPADLRTRIVNVQKRTANAVNANDESDEPGHLAGAASDWIGETTDAVWLFSAAELCGSVPANESLAVDETMCAVYDGEGAQYRLFADAQVTAFAPNAALVRRLAGQDDDATPTTWWLRTKMLEFGDGFWLVGTDGTPLNALGEDVRVVNNPEFAPDESWAPDHARGVIAGFCL